MPESMLSEFVPISSLKPNLKPRVIEESNFQSVSSDIKTSWESKERNPYPHEAVAGDLKREIQEEKKRKTTVFWICKTLIHAIIFIVLLFILIHMNILMMEYGDHQIENYNQRTCHLINRFDYTSSSWVQELASMGKQNVKVIKEKTKN